MTLPPLTTADLLDRETASRVASLDSTQANQLLEHMEQWHNPTIEAVRNLCLSGMLLVPIGEDAPEDARNLVATVPEGIQKVIAAGRLFDLGDMPNSVIIPEAKRGGPLWGAGHIDHPFREPYCLFHRWEAGGSLYLIDPFDHTRFHKFHERACIIFEFQTVQAKGVRFLFGGDTVMMWPDANDLNRNHGDVIFSTGNVWSGDAEAERNRHSVFQSLADPMVAALLLLNTDGVAVDRIEPTAALNKARVKSGKAPLPGHYRVNTADYVTAITGRRQRAAEGRGGHHASPMPHLRRGHLRHKHEMHGGGTVWVRDALVLIKDGVELPPSGRAFYRVQTEKKGKP